MKRSGARLSSHDLAGSRGTELVVVITGYGNVFSYVCVFSPKNGRWNIAADNTDSNLPVIAILLSLKSYCVRPYPCRNAGRRSRMSMGR